MDCHCESRKDVTFTKNVFNLFNIQLLVLMSRYTHNTRLWQWSAGHKYPTAPGEKWLLIKLDFFVDLIVCKGVKNLEDFWQLSYCLYLNIFLYPKFHFYNNFLNLSSWFPYNLNFKTSPQKHHFKKTTKPWSIKSFKISISRDKKEETVMC